MSGRSLDDDGGTIVSPVCPLCEAWCVCANLDDVPWPLAGLLVEQAVGEHVAEHVDLGDSRVETLRGIVRHGGRVRDEVAIQHAILSATGMEALGPDTLGPLID